MCRRRWNTASPLLHRRRRARARAAAARARHGEPGEIGDLIAQARHQLEQAYRFRYMVRNDDVERATEELAALVERELQLAATMACP